MIAFLYKSINSLFDKLQQNSCIKISIDARLDCPQKTINSRGRHFFLTIISASQYLKNLSPLCRSNSDYVFCGQSNRASIVIDY